MKFKAWSIVGLLITVTVAGCQDSETEKANLTFYGRVCLGPDKTNQDSILQFIANGETIFLDRNKDDIPQPEEQLQSSELALIKDNAAGVAYQIKELRLTKGANIVSAELPQNLGLTVSISGKVNYEQIGRVVMSTDPKQSGWCHLHGRNRLIFGNPEAQLVAGDTIQLKFYIGTNAVGEAKDLGTPGILDADRSQDWSKLTESDNFSNIVPQEGGIHPELTIEIPTRGETFIERLPLNEYCCGSTFACSVHVPQNAVTGLAKLKATFDQWTGDPIDELMVELPVVSGEG